MVVQVGSYTNK